MGKEIFSEDNIILNAKFDSKWDAIRACGRILVNQGYAAEAYIDDMMKREEVASVYVGNHLAIPHGVANSEANIFESGISFIQVPDGIAFGNEIAYLFIGIAGKDGQHIEILGNIAMVCSDLETIELLRKTTDKKLVYDTFSNIKLD